MAKRSAPAEQHPDAPSPKRATIVAPLGVEDWFLPADIIGALVDYLPVSVVHNTTVFRLFRTCRWFHQTVDWHDRKVARWQTLLKTLDATPEWHPMTHARVFPPPRTVMEKNVGLEVLNLSDLPRRYFPSKATTHTFLAFMPNLWKLTLPVDLFYTQDAVVVSDVDRGHLLQHVPSLRHLTLVGRLHHVTVSFLRHLPNLTKLVLRGGLLGPQSSPATLMGATQLTALVMLESIAPPGFSFRPLANLCKLACSVPGASATFWDDMASLSHITKLTVRLAGPPAAQAMARACHAMARSLVHLTVEGAGFPVRALAGLQNLRTLTINTNGISDITPADDAGGPAFPFPQLEELVLGFGGNVGQYGERLRAADLESLVSLERFTNRGLYMVTLDMLQTLRTLEAVHLNGLAMTTRQTAAHLSGPLARLPNLKHLRCSRMSDIDDDGLVGAIDAHPSLIHVAFFHCHRVPPTLASLTRRNILVQLTY